MMDRDKLVLGYLCLGALTHVAEAALLPPFNCDDADYCNTGDVDQYCTSGRNPKCANCWEEEQDCFTEKMPTKCTLYCKAQYKETVLKEARETACPALGNVTGGSHNASMIPLPGEVIQITCDEGYRVQGDDIIRCLQFGQWSQELPTCEEIVCPKLMVAYGEVSGPMEEVTMVGGYLSYHCAEGYAPASTESRAVCLSNGTWQSLACDKVKALSIIEDSTKDTVLTVVAIFGGLCCVVLLVVLACTCCRGKEKLCNMCSKRRNVKRGYSQASISDEPVSQNVHSSSEVNTTTSCDPDQTSKMEYINEQPNGRIKMDKKQQSKPLSPRQKHKEPSAPRYASSTDFNRRSDDSLSNADSLPSVASSGASSTDPKKEVQPEPVPSSSPGPSTKEEGPQSGGGEPAQNNFKLSYPGLQLSFNVYNNNNNSNLNHNDLPDQNCNQNNNTTLPDEKNTQRKEEAAEESPDKTPYPTQATEDATKGGHSQGTDSGESNTAGDGIHAQPVDHSKKNGKVALRNNDVAFSDLKRKRTHSPPPSS